ncbi:hypothetical protein Vadar_020844 [Vaccinium darrowii]|uniref:Uncharacterized protein n=1 Tax=Vaccinium darrowii TaxID=229202 RepID=A0ACB7Y8J1_9ERIC|nr:hypothetical protein Vadar_020844 [Vaccinium darrowii]
MSTTACKWSELPPDLLTSIGKCLKTRIDVLRFRSVCSSWRFSLRFGTWPLPLPLTLPFPIVPHSFPHPRGHYTLTEATVYRLHNPSDSPPSKWIIKVSDNLPQGRMRLLNPLSRDEITRMPILFDFSQFRISEICQSCSLGVTYDDFDNRIGMAQLNQEMINTVQKAVFFDNLTVVVIHNNGDLAGLRHGDERWTVIEYGGKGYSDLINFKGKIYTVSDRGDCLVIDSALSIRESSSPWNYLSGKKKHLVESCGELWLVAETDWRPRLLHVQNIRALLMELAGHGIWFEAYKLKEVEQEWVEVSDLGDRLLFVGRDCCSFSVSAADFEGCNRKGNCIFFLNDSYNEDFDDDNLDASSALWGPDYYEGNIAPLGFNGKEPKIYRVGHRRVDRLEAHPGFAHLFRPLPSLLASASSSSSLNPKCKCSGYFFLHPLFWVVALPAIELFIYYGFAHRT